MAWGRVPWTGSQGSGPGTAFSVGPLREPSCSCPFFLFFPPVPQPHTCGQLEGAEEMVQTTLPTSSESSTPPRSQARIPSSCRCFPREPRQLVFWHVELVEIGHSFRLRLTRLSGFLGNNSNRLRNWSWGHLSSESERSPSLAREPYFPPAPQMRGILYRRVKAFHGQR